MALEALLDAASPIVQLCRLILRVPDQPRLKRQIGLLRVRKFHHHGSCRSFRVARPPYITDWDVVAGPDLVVLSLYVRHYGPLVLHFYAVYGYAVCMQFERFPSTNQSTA